MSHKPMDECPLEYVFCSHCHEHTVFEQDEDGDWLSVCCYARPMPVDVELDDFLTEVQSDELLAADLDAAALDSYLTTDGGRE